MFEKIYNRLIEFLGTVVRKRVMARQRLPA